MRETLQKHLKGQIVKVKNRLPKYMLNYSYDCSAIIEHSRYELTGNDGLIMENHRSYSLLILNLGMRPIRSESWYMEDQFEVTREDSALGLSIIERYLNDK